MVLFSADLTVIQDSIIKVGDKIARDYVELEILQSSHKGSNQFSAMVVDFVKKKLYEYFKTKKPAYDVIFYGDNPNSTEFTSDFRYLINPIAGRINLYHAIPYFAVSIALQKKNKDGEYKTFCGIIDNPITQETFMVEEGRGAYVNTRRIRVSARSKVDDAFVVIENIDDREFIGRCVKKYKNIAVTNCDILNICNVASGKYDATILKKYDIFEELPFLLAKEAGALIKKFENGEIVICNDLLYSSFESSDF